MPLQVLVSYSWANAAERRALESELAQIPNATVLVDRNYIGPGDNIHERVAEMIDAADCVIVLLTKAGLDSAEVRDEISRCHDRKKRIIPVVDSAATLAELPWYLRDVRWIRYAEREFDRVVEELTAAVRSLANPLSPAEVQALPAGIQSLLESGARLLVTPEPATRARIPPAQRVFLRLAMRQSAVEYVVCAHPQASLAAVAEYLAHEVFPHVHDEDYEWLLTRDGRELPNTHTVEASGLRNGDSVLLLGNHRAPRWAPAPPG